MYRLITQIDGKLNEGNCSAPYKIVYPIDKSRPAQSELSPKRIDVLENSGDVHLYKDSRLVASLNQDSQLPLVRSTVLLVLGLSEASLDELVNPLIKRKTDVIEIEVLKDRNRRIYLLIVFKQLPASEQFFTRYQFRLMDDGSHLLCLFLKDSIYLRQTNNESFETVFLLGKVDSDFKDWIQLPTCLSCLEKIECLISGINYISYEHEDTKIKPNCAVCQKLLTNTTTAKCQDCQQERDLWACLICGHLGCGRYKQGHAEEHFTDKNHTLSIELQTQRIWNYLSDSFAHRIIKSGGQDVLNFPEYDFDDTKLESVEGLLWEYCTKISEELEKQRINYTNKLEDIQSHHCWEQKELRDEIAKLQEQKKAKQKEADAVNNRKLRIEVRKKELRDQIEQEKELNKILERKIKTTKYAESQALRNKRKELKEIEDRIDRMLNGLDFN